MPVIHEHVGFIIQFDSVIKAKSLVEKVFGPKFHVDFPSRRRDIAGDCGQGLWPTDTNGKYTTLGVDVLAKEGEEVCKVKGALIDKSDKLPIQKCIHDIFLTLCTIDIC